MEDVKRVIFDYLIKNSVKSALLINGQWGSGKTHFVKNIIIPQIETKFIDNDPVVIYQSLYGVKSKEELKLNLYIDAIPNYKFTKKFKKPGLKFLVSSILHIWNINLTSWLGNLSSSTILKQDKNYVFIFDDLERVDEELGIKSVMGWLNNFVEHSGFKTILIGDEKRISEKENYDKIKEKLVGTTIKFETPDNVLDQLNENKLGENWEDKLIRNNGELIKQLYLHGADQNLRSYEFALDKLQYILKTLEKIKDDLTEEIIRRLIIYTMAVSFELKKGNISEKNIGQLEQEGYGQILGINAMMQREWEQEEEEPINEVINSYFSNLGYPMTFFEAINSLIVRGRFDTDKLTEQVRGHLGDGLDEKQNTYNKLYHFRQIDDETELNRVVTTAIRLCENGDYSLSKTLFIADILFYLSYKGALPEELENLYDRFENILNRNRENFEPNNDFGLHITDTNREYGNNFEQLFEIAEEINDRSIQMAQQEKYAQLFNLFTEDTENFLEVIWSTNNDFRFKPIFTDWNSTDTSAALLNLSSKHIQSLKRFFSERYENRPDLLAP